MTSIDLNADLGEGFGHWRLTDDERLLSVVTNHTREPAALLSPGTRVRFVPVFATRPGT